jgi:hypothetical protein
MAGRLLKQKIGSHPAGRSNSLGEEIMDKAKTALDQEIPLPLELTRRNDELAPRRRELRGCAWTRSTSLIPATSDGDPTSRRRSTPWNAVSPKLPRNMPV